VITDIARDVPAERRLLFVGMRFSNPVLTMQMREVIYTPETSEETIDTARRLAEAAGKVVSIRLGGGAVAFNGRGRPAPPPGSAAARGAGC
jgi:3-hydroxyacyl-CoA dehydrogenase